MGAGLDLFHLFDAARYNEAVRGHARLSPLPLFGRSGAAAALIGNTRAIWPPFLAAVRDSDEMRCAAHPLDRYVEEAIRGGLAGTPIRWEVRFSHEGGERLVSMLHAAEASGFASVGPAYLAAHPVHGPWFGLRAVVVFDAPAPSKEPAPASAALPCSGCPAPCKGALDRAVAKAGASWRDWLAVRDACPVGKESRYPEDQLRYHYTKERDVFAQPGRTEA